LLQILTAQSVAGEIDTDRSNLSQPLYAKTGHSIGHSQETAVSPSSQSPQGGPPTNEPTPSIAILVDALVRAFKSGNRPEKIQKLYPAFRLSQIYGIIAIHLLRQEAEQRDDE
jgi:hypothetical protein